MKAAEKSSRTQMECSSLSQRRRIWLVMFMKAVSVLWFVCKQVGTDQRSEGADEQLDLKQWDVRRVDSTQKDSGCLKVS